MWCRTEARVVGCEGDARVIVVFAFLDFGFAEFAHILRPRLRVRQPLLMVLRLHFERRRKHVRQFRAKTVATTGRAFLQVLRSIGRATNSWNTISELKRSGRVCSVSSYIVIATRSHVTEHELRYVHIRFGVHLHGQAFAVVPNRDFAGLFVDRHLQGCEAKRHNRMEARDCKAE